MGLGRDLQHGAKSPWTDPSTLELSTLAVLRREAAAAGLATHQAEAADRPAYLLTYARLGLELARRTGETDTLARAASAAERAGRLASNVAGVAAARLLQADCALTAGSLFAEPHALDAAQEWIATPEVAAAAEMSAEAFGLRARIAGARALRAADMDMALEAAGVFDDAVDRLDALAREDSRFRAGAAAIRCERAEFLIGFGARLKDKALVVQAEADLRQLTARLGGIDLPLTWARAEALRGAAKAALGDLAADDRALFDAVRILAVAVEKTELETSPLDQARFSHALGLSLVSLAEATEHDDYYEHALAAFDCALASLDAAPALPLRAMVVHDRAVSIARRAEWSGDLDILDEALDDFRRQLAVCNAAADPVAWAIIQVSLARLYEVRANLEGRSPSTMEIALALNEALDVFSEHGLKTLSDSAADALARLREASRTV